jgi:hypothetical protein
MASNAPGGRGMSEFDNLKNEAEQLAQEHPDQVKEGEQFAEKEAKDLAGKEFGGQGDQDSGQGGQDSGQNQ